MAMLSYKRSISQGRALMYAVSSLEGSDPSPVLVDQVGVRGTNAFNFWEKMASDKKNNAPVQKGIEDASSPNPQRIEVAILPEAKPFLKVCFEAKYSAQSSKPYMSNVRETEVILRDMIKNYGRIGGFKLLSEKYVVPLVTGLWMWRNNDEALSKQIKITVKHGGEGMDGVVYQFNPGYSAFSLDALSYEDKSKALELAGLLASALIGDIPLLALHVEAVYEIGGGCAVFPSQEMIIIDDSKVRPEDKVSRTLYKVSHGGINNHAAIHEQKIGNALRCIDDMHGDDHFGVQSIEPLGVVSTHLSSTRLPTKRDFYSLFGSKLKFWSEELKVAESVEDIKTDVQDLHYFVAVFVRGGAFV